MTRRAADRVKAVWNGTGTGTISLGGASSAKHQAFPIALDGQVVSYIIEHETAQEVETGYGTYTHSGATLSRAFRTYPTFGGAAVSFSAGTKNVSITPLGAEIVPEVSTVDPTSSDSISSGFLQGFIWINTTTPSVWICISHAAGSAIWVRIDAAAALISVDQWDILIRLASGSGLTVGAASGDLTSKTPAAGDKLFGWADTGEARIFDVGAMPTAGDAAPTKVTSNAATFALASTDRLYLNKRIVSHQASVVFEVPQAASAESQWLIMPVHDGCTVTINGGVGTLTPSPARLVNGGLVIVTVTSNPGSAPVVEVRGEVIAPMTAVTTKTYDLDDHAQDFGATGTQTFNTAAASIPNGYYVNIWNCTGGNLTVDGLDADHTIPANGAVTVKKRSDGALVCNGAGGNTVLDAA